MQTLPEKNAKKGDEQAEERGGIFKQYAEGSRVFTEMNGRPQPLILGGGEPELAVGDPKRVAFTKCRDPQDGVVPWQVSQKTRVPQVQNSFVGRYDSSTGKDQHSDNECPEIQLFTVAERMGIIRRSTTATKAEQEQRAVSSVDQR